MIYIVNGDIINWKKRWNKNRVVESALAICREISGWEEKLWCAERS